ncbi:MAG: (2Fe-2S)-binding protein [Defluviitaleaceae bacterium]|nr:(2Fe-2S)-binding protein [Defluviitaleaceae bacterium]
MLEKTGVPTPEQVDSIFPTEERLSQGPIAIIECFQPIPCDPCATSCPQGAIAPFMDINDLPIINNKKCNGCGICIMKCPGLAIIVLDMTYSETQALIRLPYEFSPLPQIGEIVLALDRSGAKVAEAEVIRVTKGKPPIISIAVDKALVKTLRNIRPQPSEAAILCRCSDLNTDDIREFIAQGHTTVDAIKRLSRLGMGPCQGRTCTPLIIRELATVLSKPVESFQPGTYRPVVKSIKLGELAEYTE